MADEGLSAGAVARRLGVAVTTLRTWHQRYGLGPSHHEPGHHRRYTPEDLARLEVMRRLTAQGVTPAEAARWARRVPTDVVSGAAPDRVPVGRHGGGRAIAVGRAGPAARGLARAAMRLDAPAMRDMLVTSIAERGVVATWDTTVRPVLLGIGARYAATAAFVEVEHLLSRTVSEVLSAVPRPGPEVGPSAILLACTDEEQHSLPLEALAAALAEARHGCRLLGARVPPTALRDAINRTGPAAVVLWAQLPNNADPGQLTALLTGPRRPLVVVAAGPGWARDTIPDGVACPANLAEALAITTAAASPGRSLPA